MGYDDAYTKVVRPARMIAEPNAGFQKKLKAFHASNEFQVLRTELGDVAARYPLPAPLVVP